MMQEHLRDLAKESSYRDYYWLKSATYYDAYNFLIESIPQFTLELSDADNKIYKGVLGMYPKESTYTSVVYNESNWHSYVNSLYGEKNYINPMITILSLSHLYSKTNKTVVYCLNSLNEINCRSQAHIPYKQSVDSSFEQFYSNYDKGIYSRFLYCSLAFRYLSNCEGSC